MNLTFYLYPLVYSFGNQDIILHLQYNFLVFLCSSFTSLIVNEEHHTLKKKKITSLIIEESSMLKLRQLFNRNRKE